MEQGIHIELAAETIGHFLGVPVTNTLLMSYVVLGVLLLGGIFLGTRIRLIPGRVQTLLEWLFGGVYEYITETLGSEKLARRFFPLITTIFLFVFTANLMEFIPGVGSVGFFHEGVFVPLLRSMNTDLNMTLALSIIAFLTIEITGVVVIGVGKYAGKFFNFHSPMGFAVGIIEFFSEFARLVSFSFRLFGNIFAGEVLLLVVGHFVPYFLPVPLMAFEVFVGFIQAAIFAVLTLFFIKIAIAEPH